MTNELELVREMTDEERGVPCFVRHEDAGGRCGHPATVRVYGLNFCAAHGEEAKLGALFEAGHDAKMFFLRFRNPDVPPPSGVVASALEAAIDYVYEHYEDSTGKKHDRALEAAYPAPPEAMREKVLDWIAGEQEGRASVYDTLSDTLRVLHKLMRIGFEERVGVWLLELLEQERESVAAQAAVALGNMQLVREGYLE